MVYNFLYKLVALIIRFICRINGGLEVIGKDNIPLEGGVIVAANHISYLDPPLIGAVVPRNATFMARKGLFEIPVLGWMIKDAAFPVDRERTRPSTIKEAVKRLKKGELIAMFPEGRRSETGELMEARRGIGMLACLSKVPVVPALITGSDRALPVDAGWLRRAKITVIFGKPVYFTSTADEKGYRNHELHEKISNKVMAA
ncbi:MAG TPA: 1-acyl-sn-glycerol-3-phosphate acyltransferase, partial [Nitrospirae bacterium]|nr:1-acyl-sn-glycerol-3-phosphate acyltransferase [Nitrospirota bacterium]